MRWPRPTPSWAATATLSPACPSTGPRAAPGGGTRGRPAMSGELGPVDRLLERAMTLAGAWEARARIATTVGQERALLRLFGVSGLDRAGRPLAGEVVDRYLAGGTRRLAGGVALPFAAALLEYEPSAQRSPSTWRPGRSISASKPRSCAMPAVARPPKRRSCGSRASPSIASGRTGSPPRAARRPRRRATTMDRRAARRGRAMGRAPARRPRPGRGSLAVGGRPGRPRARRSPPRRGRGHPRPPPVRPPDGTDGGPDDTEEPPVRQPARPGHPPPAADEAAAERRRYVRLASTAPGLAAPEQAVVAAFERIDLVVADPVAEIVDGKIDPDRALADHSFAHRLHRRAGARAGRAGSARRRPRPRPWPAVRPAHPGGPGPRAPGAERRPRPPRRAERRPGRDRRAPGMAARRARADCPRDRPGGRPPGGLRGASGGLHRAAGRDRRRVHRRRPLAVRPRGDAALCRRNGAHPAAGRRPASPRRPAPGPRWRRRPRSPRRPARRLSPDRPWRTPRRPSRRPCDAGAPRRPGLAGSSVRR